MTVSDLDMKQSSHPAHSMPPSYSEVKDAMDMMSWSNKYDAGESNNNRGPTKANAMADTASKEKDPE